MVDTAEPDTGNDSFEVIAVEDGQPANYMLVQRQSSGWQYRSFDMARYAGKEINLIFNVYETSPNRRTTALVDVVTLSNVPAQSLTSSGPSARPRPAEARTPPPNSTTPSAQEGSTPSGYRVYLPTVLNVGER